MNNEPNQTSGIPPIPQNNEQAPVHIEQRVGVSEVSEKPKPKVARRIVAWVFLAGVAIFVGLNFTPMTDYLWARTVAAPDEKVVAIADDISLTPGGRDIFYASQPLLAPSAKDFPCKSGETSSVILGCYSSSTVWFDKGQIYILDVKNSALDGVVQVTAAHEMLHAAYHRLSFLERTHIDKLVSDQYMKLRDDPVLKEQMEYYHANEPGQDVNELHSILGTTVAKLDPELERYYARYFTDRANVIALYTNYSSALHQNDQKINDLKAKLDTEAAALAIDTERYEADLSQLNVDIQSFNTRASSGGFGSQSAFTAARAALLARTAALNARSDLLNSRVAAYNEDVKTINSLSAQTEELYSSLKGVAVPGMIES
ncbi:MAG: hypothetical protein WBP22_01670 [Candidatus Saccharimonas sp.]